MNNNIGIDLFIIQSVVALLFIFIILWFLRIKKVSNLNKRFSRFCLEPLEDDSISLFDKGKNFYNEIRKKLSRGLIKLTIFNDYSKKYQKYCDKSKIIRDDAMAYIADKVIVGFLCIVVVILSDMFQYKAFSFMQFITAFLIGFFIPDVYLYIREGIRKKQIEKDMLKAIIIMNNAFKSGFSIIQAIYTVYHELDGPIADEFRKLYIDLTFGLNTEVAFERFNKRVDNKEAKYITTSLNVLNKTGGNIVQVFASVERSAFTRKKLEEELKSLSASANAIFKILVFIPVLLFIAILLMNPTYFNPLFTTSIGLAILGLIVIIYISYIFIISKVVKAGIK